MKAKWLLIVLSSAGLCACAHGSAAATASAVPSASPADEKTGGAAGLANPWTDNATEEELEAAVGFSLAVPASIDGYDGPSFRYMEDMAEADYRDSADHRIVIRKTVIDRTEGNDISGDYHAYSQSVTVPAEDGGELMLYGNEDDGGKANKVLWTEHGYAYSLGADLALTKADILALASQIR